MLSAVGLFERTDGAINASAYAAVGLSDSDFDPGNSPDYTFADALAGYEWDENGGSGVARMDLKSYHGTPVGESSPVIYSTIDARPFANSHGPDMLSVVEGSGYSWGRYDIDLNGVSAVDAVLKGTWILKTNGPDQDLENGIRDVVTDQRVEIVTIDDEAQRTRYYVTAVSTRDQTFGQSPYDGSFNAEWIVTYDLPEFGFNTYTKLGHLNEVFADLEWDLDDVVAVEISSSFDTTSSSLNQGIAYAPGPDDYAGFNWATLTHASLSLAARDSDWIPGGVPVPPEFSPPKVTGVTIDSTNPATNDPAYDFSDNGNVGSGEQLRTVPVGGANQVVIQFSEDVSINQSRLKLLSLNPWVDVPNASFSYNSGTHTATLTYASALPPSQYLLQVFPSVKDADNNSLDGEWTNPGSINTPIATVFPSGDGVAGGTFEFVFTILPGDANRDNIVNMTDAYAWLENFDETGKSWSHGDFTGDGYVYFEDYDFIGDLMDEDWRNLSILGDYDFDFDVDGDDQDAFYDLYGLNDIAADIDGDGDVNYLDAEIFSTELLRLDLRVLT